MIEKTMIEGITYEYVKYNDNSNKDEKDLI
jgi:hypothetical protein